VLATTAEEEEDGLARADSSLAKPKLGQLVFDKFREM
jgi:hypothetical protein